MGNNAIETHGLCRSFGSKRALWDFSLRIEQGGVHAIIGSNGAGKSTLFRVLLGFLTPSAGTSLLLGEDSARLSPKTRGAVCYVNEEHTLPGWLKVRQLKAMQRSYYPRWDDEIYRKVIANFEVDPEQKVSSLSRGERAGFNLAMALAQRPQVLILDEPTLGLDVVAKQEFLDAVLFYTDTESTVIYCSHQMEEVERLAEQLIIIEKGRLKCQATPEAFSRRFQQWIVDARFRTLLLDQVPGILNGRVIEGQFHACVLDPGDDVPNRLAALGVDGLSCAPVGLDTAVRAFLAVNHAGTGSEELA